MDLQEYIKRTDNVVKAMSDFNGGWTMVHAAIVACTFIKGRVIETGVDSKGQKYKPYSTKAMLIGCKSFNQEDCKTVFGSKEKRKKMEWRTVNGHRLAILPGGYRKWRQIVGAQVDHVDFSVNNDMWNNILVKKKGDPGLLSTDADHKSGVAKIGPREEKQKKKLAGNEAKRGPILALSEDEIRRLKELFSFETLEIYRDNGLL